GTYEAQDGRITASLHILSRLTFIAMVDSGEDWYHSEARFSTTPVYQHDKEGFSVTIKRSSNNLGNIINVLEEAAEGIAAALAPGHESYARAVRKCVYQLEERIKPLHGQREEAKKQRNMIIYGKRNPRDDKDPQD